MTVIASVEAGRVGSVLNTNGGNCEDSQNLFQAPNPRSDVGCQVRPATGDGDPDGGDATSSDPRPGSAGQAQGDVSGRRATWEDLVRRKRAICDALQSGRDSIRSLAARLLAEEGLKVSVSSLWRFFRQCRLSASAQVCSDFEQPVEDLSALIDHETPLLDSMARLVQEHLERLADLDETTVTELTAAVNLVERLESLRLRRRTLLLNQRRQRFQEWRAEFSGPDAKARDQPASPEATSPGKDHTEAAASARPAPVAEVPVGVPPVAVASLDPTTTAGAVSTAVSPVVSDRVSDELARSAERNAPSRVGFSERSSRAAGFDAAPERILRERGVAIGGGEAVSPPAG